MILFASGRTDIPAFYSEWLMKRIREGFVLVRNPYYKEQVTRYRLTPDVVDCLVFCTKNPAPLLPYIDELKKSGLGLYFFVTITPYASDVEPQVPAKEAVMETFAALSAQVGKAAVCWRYDPIFIDSTYTVSAHIRAFRTMAETLAPTTDRCIISFIDLYEKTKRNFPELREVSEVDQRFLAQAFSSIGRETGIQIESCAEKLDLSDYGIQSGACISRTCIEGATGIRLLPHIAAHPLRKHCACLPTHDIGAYNSCPHLCRYCYANYDARLVAKNHALHDPDSPFLLGGALPGDVIHDARQQSFRDTQLLLL